MTARLPFLLFAVTSFTPHVALAQGAGLCATSRVAVVQRNAILGSVPRYAEKDTALGVFVANYRVELSRLQGVMDSVARAYRDKAALLGATARQLELGKLNEQNAQVQQRIESLQAQLARERDNLLQPIEAGVQAVLDSVQREQRCAVVFDVNAGGGIATVAKSIDLTQRVIDRIKATGDTAIFGPPLKLQRP